MVLTIKAALNVGTIVFGAASSYCWVRSASARVPHAHASGDGMFHDGTIAVDGADLVGSLKLQAKWNTRAAICAAVATGFQVLGACIPEGTDPG
ncbi:hypothetical protein [Cupriavidus sp. TMH.W2]|uniref:hypothetical protein n=1 Tax=Cupriavidus sp. TMH.W2 TaxID=3434465 RepID=UPI003D7769EA